VVHLHPTAFNTFAVGPCTYIHAKNFIKMKQLLFLLAILLFAGCKNKDVIFEEHKELSADYEWKKADTRTFSIDIKDNSKPLELAVAFRCATGYMYDKVFMRITEISPANTKHMYDVEIPVRNADGEFFGEKGFDIIDIEYVVDRVKYYQGHGTYTYTIEQTMQDVDPLNYAMEVGLILRQQPSKQ
jgi:gliding motility-associated lipoprotein GldH